MKRKIVKDISAGVGEKRRKGNADTNICVLGLLSVDISALQVGVNGQEQFWHCKMFDSNHDLHPLDGSSTHIPGTIKGPGDSLVVQWLRLHLPTKEAQV